MSDMLTWRKIAMSLTPGGSEFTDPDYTREYLQDQKQTCYEYRKQNVLLKKENKHLAVENTTLLELLEDRHSFNIEHQHCKVCMVIYNRTRRTKLTQEVLETAEKCSKSFSSTNMNYLIKAVSNLKESL